LFALAEPKRLAGRSSLFKVFEEHIRRSEDLPAHRPPGVARPDVNIPTMVLTILEA
jgi:hypothetical protein